VVKHFSGYLCVDEVHDGPYCTFYAVDAILQKRIAFQISDSAGKALEFLDDPDLAATNNVVERENRRHRKRQKTIYRARTRETSAARIRFSMVHDLRPAPLYPSKHQETQPKRKAG
jgi:hypothetical protein